MPSEELFMMNLDDISCDISRSIILGLDVNIGKTVLTVDANPHLNSDIALKAKGVLAIYSESTFQKTSLNGERNIQAIVKGMYGLLALMAVNDIIRTRIDAVYFSDTVKLNKPIYKLIDRFEKGTLLYMPNQKRNLSTTFNLVKDEKLTNKMKPYCGEDSQQVDILRKNCARWKSCDMWIY
jgi:hypothetical protein